MRSMQKKKKKYIAVLKQAAIPCAILLALLAVAAGCQAEDSQPAVTLAERLFVAKIEPLFAQKCGGCHGKDAKQLKGEYDMRSRKSLLAGGESMAPAVIPGKAKQSPLLAAIEWRDGLEMPPKKNDRLDAKQIALVRQWINAGAPWPNAERRKIIAQTEWDNSETDGVLVKTSGGTTEAWTNRRYKPENLWAYARLSQDDRKLHQLKSKNPIDVLIDERLAVAKLKSLPRANRETLIRRLTFDLIGLPPTPAEIDDFVNDSSSDAFQRLTSRLLKSHHYGEHWGKHWLDVVRYADSAGFSNDFSRPNAWRFRDYVIRSFNADKPYNDFVLEQIAGDELFDQQLAEGQKPSIDLLIAAGFLRMGPWEHTAMSVAPVTRQQFLDDITNNVGVTFLGHELRCASCHDHKFDPIPTQDYYRMQAVFAPVQFADRPAPYQTAENTTGFAKGEDRIKRLQKVGGVSSLRTIPRKDWPVAEFDADTERIGQGKVSRKRTGILRRELNRFKPLAFSVYSGRARSLTSNSPTWPLPKLGQRSGPIPEVRILTGGSLESAGTQVSAQVLSVVNFAGGLPQTNPGDQVTNDKGSELSMPQTMHGRRFALAKWLTNERHPLTARVIVNRVWQYHFGHGLAGNPNNFGATGKKPTHPELLDFLARYLIEQNWSIKSLHRLIVSSNAWQRSSGPISPAIREQDPDNKLFAYFSPRRLSAEELRDSMLFVTGELNAALGGIPAHPEIHKEIAMQPRHIMGSVAPAYQPDPTPQQRNRRTIYAERIRTLRDPLLEVFNQPGLDTSCEQRDSSTISPQAFTLLNSETSFNRALAFAQRLTKSSKTIDAQLSSAFQRAFGRKAVRAEIDRCRTHYELTLKEHKRKGLPTKVPRTLYIVREMVEEMTGLTFFWVEDLDLAKKYVPDLQPEDVSLETRALADVCLVLFNTNEFIYVY